MNVLLTAAYATLALGTATVVGVTPVQATQSAQPALASVCATATVDGKIRSIAEDNASFVVVLEDGSTVSIKVTDKTVYMLDGKKSTRSDALKVGRTVTITHEERTASRVDVTSA